MAKVKTAECLFCQIIRGDVPAQVVFSDTDSIAILDYRPVFHGHVLLLPKAHHATFPELPADLIHPLFFNAQQLVMAVQKAMQADGTFVAMNNTVSQSVPHLHIHIVPRKKKDGLRGFFWPLKKYADQSDMSTVAERIRQCL